MIESSKKYYENFNDFSENEEVMLKYGISISNALHFHPYDFKRITLLDSIAELQKELLTIIKRFK